MDEPLYCKVKMNGLGNEKKNQLVIVCPTCDRLIMVIRAAERIFLGGGGGGKDKKGSIMSKWHREHAAYPQCVDVSSM